MRSTSRRGSGDLTMTVPPTMSWTSTDAPADLRRLYEWAQDMACAAIDWYMQEKHWKARWSRSLRAAAAILAAAGGAVPIAALSAGRPALGNWGFLLLAMAAGCVTFDRFFGYSSAWLRYVGAAMSLRALLGDFQLSWAGEMARLGESTVAAGDFVRLVEAIRGFVWSVNQAIRAETESWVLEFHTRLQEMESQFGPRERGASTERQAAPRGSAGAAPAPGPLGASPDALR
jgi:hypothetical protein